MGKLSGVKNRLGKMHILAAAVLVGTCLAALPCHASVINGGFDTGLTGWTIDGDVQAGPEATLGDFQAIYSLLYQGVNLSPGTYVLEFDLLNELSRNVPVDPFAFADTFFASLYYTNDMSTFDLANNIFDGVDPVLDMDASGPFNVYGNVGPSALGGGWLHVSFAFSTNYAYAIPVFELFDFNTIDGDSGVRVDNVAITPRATDVVPEPTTMALTAVGLLGFAVRRMRASR